MEGRDNRRGVEEERGGWAVVFALECLGFFVAEKGGRWGEGDGEGGR